MGLLYGRRRGSSRVWLDFARIVSYNILAWIPRVSAVSAALARRHPCQNRIPGCSAVGSAPALGAGCRGFESLHSDQIGTRMTAEKLSVHAGFPFYTYLINPKRNRLNRLKTARKLCNSGHRVDILKRLFRFLFRYFCT